MNLLRLVLPIVALVLGSVSVFAIPINLRCDDRVDPTGIDSTKPRLSWIYQSDPADKRGARQTAYQILVSSSTELLSKDQGDLWDSGKTDSDATNQIPYAGKALGSAQGLWWKVRTWDETGKASDWSKPARWTMGLLNDSDWSAKWIAPAGPKETFLSRKQFTVKPNLKRALAFTCGLGQYEFSINGKRVGEDLIQPGWTMFNKTSLYATNDITALLQEGQNVAGGEVGNGFYNVTSPKDRYTKLKNSFGAIKLIAQIQLEYADGSREIIGTDDTWKTSAGPITFFHQYGGEDHDARLEQSGWNAPGFDDSKWTAAAIVEGPGGRLRGLSCSAPPIESFDVLKPISTKRLNPTTQVVDLGQNASLMPRITVKGAAGSVVRVVPSELINDDGTIDRSSFNRGGKLTYWQYTLAGRGSETWFPTFFYHGARYFQLECRPAEGSEDRPIVESIEGLVVHGTARPVGTFESSSDLFNRIHTLVRWAQRSNMMSVMTDCPHREKLGWLEEDHLNGPSLRYEFDLSTLFTKQMNDMADCQLDSGLIPSIAPEYTIFGKPERNAFGDSPEWGSAYVLVPWQQYEFHGDVELLRRHYDGMKRYVAYLKGKSKDNIVNYGLGDWYDIGPKAPGVAQLTPVALTATAFYFYDTWILSKTAALLGKADEAKEFEKSAAEIREAFNREFYKPDTRQYATGSQCANSIPLVMGICDAQNYQAVLDNIVKDVRDRGNALTAGDVGYRYLLRALADGGQSNVIFDMNNQSEKPGYGYQLAHGATSLTEAWNTRRASSQNHFMLGQINEWFYHDLAGIQCDPDGPGFKKIIIRPAIVGDLTWVKATFDSANGRIESAWKHQDGKITLDVMIPPNTSATIWVPANTQAPITENGQRYGRSEGVKPIRSQGKAVICEVGSGKYHFEAYD